MANITRHAKRIGVGITGGVVLLVGLVTIPYPGPGWLIVFAGLAILATEFEWAQTLLDKAKAQYEAWQRWVAAQPFGIRFAIFALTALIVVVTIWLLNGYGLIDNWLNLGQDWIHSPLPFFK